jgi:excisionase family DNA binding protein
MTKGQAAEYAQVSAKTIQRAIRLGALRAGRTPGLVRIRREWVDEWLERRDDGEGAPG